MTFANIAVGSTVFVDANVFVYALAPDPQLGPACRQLLERIEQGEVRGVTATSILSDVTHRLMTLEACQTFGWPFPGIAQRLKRHRAEIQKLTRFRLAAESMLAIGLQIVTVAARHLTAMTALTQQHSLLCNDALIVALMQEQGLTQLASHDADFDIVPGIVRYRPA